MIVLVDTAQPVVRLVLVDSQTSSEAEWEAHRQLAKGLLGWLERQLTEKAKEWQDIEGIGVYRGPGSFTGLRIGLTVMNTLAESLGRPIVGATGSQWGDEAIGRLRAGENDELVLPLYDRDATITTQRK